MLNCCLRHRMWQHWAGQRQGTHCLVRDITVCSCSKDEHWLTSTSICGLFRPNTRSLAWSLDLTSKHLASVNTLAKHWSWLWTLVLNTEPYLGNWTIILTPDLSHDHETLVLATRSNNWSLVLSPEPWVLVQVTESWSWSMGLVLIPEPSLDHWSLVLIINN